MSIMIGSARHDENGNYYYGAKGDQTQTSIPDYSGEVAQEKFYVHSSGWYVLRAKSITHADKLAEAMIRACNNKNIGYSMNDRYGIVTYGTGASIRVNSDCSSLVRTCIKEACERDLGDFTTASEPNVLLNSGLFDKHTYTNGFELCTGDILCSRSQGHTAIVTRGASRRKAQPESEPVNNIGLWYRSHCQNEGWLEPVHDGMISGTLGRAERLEAFKIDASKVEGLKLRVKAHIQNKGWIDFGWIDSDTVIGTEGKSLRIEAIIIEAEGVPEDKHLTFNVHIQNHGWLGFVPAGFANGTIGLGLRIEAIKIQIA